MTKNVLTSALLLMVLLFDGLCSGAIDNPKLIKLPLGLGPQRIENTPVMYQGRPLLIENSRLSNEKHGNTAVDMYIVDLTTSEIISRFGSTFAFNSAFVRGNELNVFATEITKSDWTGSIYRFWTTDLKTWKNELVMAKEKDRHYFNTSVCETPDGYLMAYESNKPVQWSFKLARSNDLSHWEPIEEIIFADKAEGSCLANPTIRYIEPYYYAIIGIHRSKGRAAAEYQYHRADAKYFTFVLRSKDLAMWDLSPTKYPMIEPEVEDGINASDADIFEFMGNTYLFYGAGWQDTRGTIRVKMYPGTMKECLESYFSDDVPVIKFDAKNCRYIYPDEEVSSTNELAKPTPEQVQWQDAEMGMFIHFGLWSMLSGSTTSDMDVLREVQKAFNPVDLDTDQWVSVAESMGAKYVVYTVKHGDGFCMWQTDTTDFCIKNTPWRNGKGDIMADLAQSCKKRGMKLGVYLNAHNMYTGVGVGGKCATPEAQEEYNKIYRQQLTELLTRYGDIFEVWFDGSLVVPVKDILEKYSPQAMVFQSPQTTIRWVGNENGFANYPAWNCVDWDNSTVNTGYGTDRHGDPDGNKWLPLECDARIRKMWMYQAENNPLKSVDYLMEMYYHSVGYGAVLLLNNTPGPTGLIPQEDADRSAEFGAEIKRRFGKSLAEISGKGSVVTLSLDKPIVIDHVITMEDITGGERVRQYVIEGRTDNNWKQITEGISIGHKKIDRFRPVLLDGVRIRVTKSAAEPLIRKLAIYRAGAEDIVPIIKPLLSEKKVGHWKFDKIVGGKTDDSSDLNNSAKVVGAVITGGRDGNCLAFDGSDDYVSLGDFKLFHTDFTSSAWINPRKGSKDFRFIMAKEQNNVQENQCRLYLAPDNRLGFVLYDDKGQGIWPFETPQTLPYGQWSYIALTRKDKQFVLYVDGKEAARKSSDIFINHDNDEVLTIGADLAFTSAEHVFDGLIDDVKLYNRALSDQEILAAKDLKENTEEQIVFKWGPEDVKSRWNKIEFDLTPYIDRAAQFELVFKQTAGKDKLQFKSSVLILDDIEYSSYVEKLDEMDAFNLSIIGTPTKDKNSIMFRTVLSGKGSSGNVVIRKAKSS